MRFRLGWKSEVVISRSLLLNESAASILVCVNANLQHTETMIKERCQSVADFTLCLAGAVCLVEVGVYNL